MRGKQRNIEEEKTPQRFSVSFYSHRFIPLSRHGVSITYLSLPDYIEVNKDAVSINSLPAKSIFDLDHICRYATHVKLNNRGVGLVCTS